MFSGLWLSMKGENKLQLIIGGDLVPTRSNTNLFINADVAKLFGPFMFLEPVS